ncbi:hypothetical protein [Nonomuraea guangzhouensis]|nr:hypothetical protein [Nonomuraea guangzhouensis]
MAITCPWSMTAMSNRLVKSGNYPIFTKIVMEAGQPNLSRDDQFRYGLQRVLDCIAAALP